MTPIDIPPSICHITSYMEETVKKGQRAVPLQTIIIVMVTVGFIVSCLLVYFMHHSSQVFREMRESTQSYTDCQDIAADLLAKSDALTIYARGFVVTGDPMQADQYYNDTQAQNAIDEAMEEVREYSSDERVLSQLSNAMQLRDRLSVTEDYAMRLKVASLGGDISEYPKKLQGVQLLPSDLRLTAEEQDEKARNLLFDIDYESSKNEISLRITKSMDVLMAKMLERQVESSDHMLRVLYIQHSLTAVLLCSLLVLAVIIFTMVIFPLRRAVSSMSRDGLLGEEGAREVRFLARTYNRLHEQNRLTTEKLEFAANHDKLTGLYNRTAYASMLEELTAERIRMALILADVDMFKDINDHYGHDTGDSVLKYVADTLKDSFRSEDMVCRIGGDEFAVIMSNTDSAFRQQIDDKLIRMAEKLSRSDDDLPSITLSAGVAFTDQLIPDTDLFKSADIALYRVKNGGRNGRAYASSTEKAENQPFTPDSGSGQDKTEDAE